MDIRNPLKPIRATAVVAVLATCGFAFAAPVARAQSIPAPPAESKVAAPPANANPDDDRDKAGDARQSQLVLGGLEAENAGCRQWADRAARMMLLGARPDAFRCRMSSELLDRLLGTQFAIDAPFQDVLLNVPVYGQAHIEGVLSPVLVPDDARMVIELRFEGSVNLKGIGRSRGVQIHSDATTTFTAVKQLRFDGSGLSSAPADCKAATRMTTRRVSAGGPKVIGRFTERIAAQRAADSQAEAEAECSDHVRVAICDAIDRRIEQLAATVNEALRTGLEEADEQVRSRWSQTRFLTQADCISVARGPSGHSLGANWQPEPGQAIAPVVLHVPRAGIDLPGVLAALRLLAPGEKPKPNDAPREAALFAVREPVSFRPSLAVGSETVSISLEFEAPATLVGDGPVDVPPAP